MNQKIFNVLMKRAPAQHPPEWRMFMEICGAHLERYKIHNPIVVELGIYNNHQKVFYEQLFGAEHIGIDVARRRCHPDIHGNTHDPAVMERLKEKLRGRPINILFIDACHSYEAVKMDFDLYSPLCSDIIAFHDLEFGKKVGKKKREVWKFWDKMKELSYVKTGEHKDFLFISIYQHRNMVLQMGTGMIMKR